MMRVAPSAAVVMAGADMVLANGMDTLYMITCRAYELQNVVVSRLRGTISCV